MGAPAKSTIKDAVRALRVHLEVRRIRREAAALSPAETERRVAGAAAKTLVFAVSAGRTGTATLAKIFEVIPNIAAAHEGAPAFHDVMRRGILDPLLTRDFLLTRKLPAIAAAPQPIYFESSHLFGKGFMTPTLRLGLRPRIIFLKRDPRKVALSFERIGAVPGRTTGGREHLLSPADPSLLPALRWDDFSDYQLCYWYALEAIRRQRVLHDVAVRAGCRCRYLRIEDLRTTADVKALLASLELEVEIDADTTARLDERVGKAFNLKEKRAPLDRFAADLDAQEALVAQRIEACLPELSVRQMVAQYLEAPKVEPRRSSARSPRAVAAESKTFSEVLGGDSVLSLLRDRRAGGMSSAA